MEPRLSGERESLKAPAAGGLIWCTTALCAGIGKTDLGVIEMLFLLAPLVIVPLGLHVVNRIAAPCAPISFYRLARWAQPIAALLGVTAFFFPAGRWAATLATPWLAVCIFLGLFAARRILRSRARPLDALCFAIAQIYLPVGAIWFVLSRYGARPLGFYEPIVLLTAVHFHYAGFAASVLTGSVMERTRNGTRLPLLLQRLIVLFVTAGPALLAAGFLIGPTVKLAAAFVLSIGEIGLAIWTLSMLNSLKRRAAKFFLGLSSASVMAGMLLAGIWAIGEYPLQPMLNIPQMARIHGAINAVGFAACGLLGWAVEAPPPEERVLSAG